MSSEPSKTHATADEETSAATAPSSNTDNAEKYTDAKARTFYGTKIERPDGAFTEWKLKTKTYSPVGTILPEALRLTCDTSWIRRVGHLRTPKGRARSSSAEKLQDQGVGNYSQLD